MQAEFSQGASSLLFCATRRGGGIACYDVRFAGTDAPLFVIPRLTPSNQRILFALSSDKIATGDIGGDVTVYSHLGAQLGVIATPNRTGAANGCSFSPADGSLLAVASGSRPYRDRWSQSSTSSSSTHGRSSSSLSDDACSTRRGSGNDGSSRQSSCDGHHAADADEHLREERSGIGEEVCVTHSPLRLGKLQSGPLQGKLGAAVSASAASDTPTPTPGPGIRMYRV